MLYRTKGTCSSEIEFEIQDGKVHNVQFFGGCNGNLQAVSILTEGMDVHEAIQKLKGIKCGFKNTSCPDQLARALESALPSAD